MQSKAIERGEELEHRLIDLEQQQASLLRQLERVMDEQAIVRVQSAYGYYVDKGRWDDAADLFTDEARLEINQRGVYLGRERIRRYFHKLGELEFGTLFNHLQLQPIITVAPDGLTARGRWRALIQAAHLNQMAVEGEGTYENCYMKEQGVWKLSSLHFFTTFYFERPAGWERRVIVKVGEMADFPPDLPCSVDYGAYPRVFVPPYHYCHPVRDAAPTLSGGEISDLSTYVRP